MFRIIRGHQMIVDADRAYMIEEFRLPSGVGTYEMDDISLEEIDGRTRRAWEAVTWHTVGKVIVENLRHQPVA